MSTEQQIQEEFEDVRSSNELIRTNNDTKGVKTETEKDYVGFILKAILFAICFYIIYLLGSSFINYGKDGDLLIELVTEHRQEDNKDVDRYRLYTNGLIEKVNTNGTNQLGLGQTMLLNLYSKTLYRFAIDVTATSTENYQHIYVFNSRGNIIKEYDGKEMFFNLPITSWVYAEETEETTLIGG